jgi:ferritin
MKTELVEALNKQINQELRNAYLYFAMQAYFDIKSLGGFANYFKVQAKEELEHATKIYNFLISRGERVRFFNIESAEKEWGSILEVAKGFLEAERDNTEKIWELIDLAKKEGDKATETFLQWFVNEQIEEEKNAMELLAKVEMIKDNPAALLALDRILAERK